MARRSLHWYVAREAVACSRMKPKDAPVKKPKAKPIYAYAIKTRHGLDLLSISESRSELISQANKPAGQSVVAIRISQVDKHPALSNGERRDG